MGSDATTDDHRERVERSRRRWEFWSDHWSLVERDTDAVRREAVELLDLDPGDAVVDVGCGPGVNFEALREAVGPEGRVVGVDVTPGMVRGARDRIAEEEWDNVEVVLADATRPTFRDGSFDGAVATTAVSATPDVRGTVENVYDALRPGSRFGVYDIRPVPSGVARALNPLVVAFYRRFGNWNDREDVETELRARFESFREVRAFALGTNYVAVAEKAAADP